MNTLKYHLDQIIVDDKVVLKGWAFSTITEVITFCINGEKYQAIRNLREDVLSCHMDCQYALNSGFEIILPYMKKIIIEVSDNENTIKDVINPYKIRKDMCWRRRKKFLRKITFSNIRKGLLYFCKYGFSKTICKIKNSLNKDEIPPISLYEKTLYTEEELIKQKNIIFDIQPCISIIVPLFNTSNMFLVDMIESVKHQTYTHWQLCLVDGSDYEHGDVADVCQKYAQSDDRIYYQKLDANYGISGNTNKALEMAIGEYIALFDHDDILHQAALYEVVKVINEKKADFIYTDEITFMDELSNVFNPHFKPDFAIDNLRANNYICHFSVFSYKLYEKTGNFRAEYDGSQDYDMILRLTENAERIYHIPKILYYWRAHENSVAAGVSAKPYVIEAAHKAIEAHLKRCHLEGKVVDSNVVSMYKINYEIKGNPLISILIPNKDHIADLDVCLSSIFRLSTYKNYEIIIIENNSEDPKTFMYYEKIKSDNVTIISYADRFNYSAINNLGFQQSKGEYIVLLNNDTEIITDCWLEEMLMYCQRRDVGAVGAKLYYPDDTIQHAGLGIGLLTLAGHYHRHFPREHPGYMGRLSYAHDVSAVTAACLMVKRSVYSEVDGLDETFEVAFNDVDFCMKIRAKNYLIVFTPFAELYHYESKSRGNDSDPKKRNRFIGEVTRFQTKWKKELNQGDPYYNVNLTLDREDFGVK